MHEESLPNIRRYNKLACFPKIGEFPNRPKFPNCATFPQKRQLLNSAQHFNIHQCCISSLTFPNSPPQTEVFQIPDLKLFPKNPKFFPKCYNSTVLLQLFTEMEKLDKSSRTCSMLKLFRKIEKHEISQQTPRLLSQDFFRTWKN